MRAPPLLLAAIAAAAIVVALAPAAALAQQAPAAAATAAPNGVFLPTLPLTPVAATPANLLSNTSSQPLSLDSQTTFTAVFSRPVIALGSDFGLDADAPLPESLNPFIVDCPVPGRTRWVTTSIARWDPSVGSWPPDLDCELRWNKNLRSFDGAPLVLPPGAPESVRISTPGLTMTLETVRSSFLNKITGDYWNTFAGMKQGEGNPFQPADKTPEVPPDGNLTFSFSYPVSLASLADGAIKVEPCCGYDLPGGKKAYEASWASCDDRAGDDGDRGDAGLFSSSSLSSPASQNTTCAVLKIFPAIPNNGTALIRLPKGAIYNPAAGAARNETKIYVHGLRPFRLPLRQDFAQLNETTVIQQGSTNWGLINYRRLLMWLPHGLAPQNDDAQKSLLPLISICRFEKPYDWSSECKDLEKKGWTLARTKPGQVVLSVPQLEPRQHYKILVDGSDAVKDGYGQPLQFSQAFFFTNELYPAFQGPQLASSPVLAVLEADGGATASADDLPPPPPPSPPPRPSSRLFGRRGGAGAGGGTDGNDAGLQQQGPWQPLLPLSAKRAPWTLVARGNTSAPPKNFLAWRLDDASAAGVSRVLSIATNYMPVTPAMIGSVVDSGGGGGGGRRSGGRSGGKDAAPPSSLAAPYTPYFNATRPDGSQTDPAFLPFSLASPLEGAGAQFLGFCCDVSGGNGPGSDPPPPSLTNKALVLQSRLQAAVIKTDRRLTVWVTDTRARPGAAAAADGSASSSSSAAPPSPVPGAKVSIFEQDAPWDRVRARLPTANATCTTDPRGLCSVEMPPNTYGALMAVVEPPSVKAGGPSLGGPGGPLIVPNAEAYSSLPGGANDARSKNKTTLLASVVLDRELVRAGGLDPLRVTAYLQRQDGVALSPPASPLSAVVVVDPSPDPAQAARGEVYRAPATFDSVYGSVHASVVVPAGAEPRRYDVFVAVPKSSGFQSNSEADGGSRYVSGKNAEDLSLLAQASFTAADPRLPTASLTMVAPDWSPPGKDFPVLLRAESFVGSSVANASFSLEWRVNSPTTQTPASGSVDVVTDALGRARVIIPAGPALIRGINATLAGDTIDLSAVWIGPTRERVDANELVVVAEGPVKVALARSPVTDVPGVPFGVTARAFASNRESTPLDLPPLGGADDDDGGGGVEVEVSLAAAELPPGAIAVTGGVAAARRAAAELAVSQGFDAKRAFDLAADPLAGCSSEQRAKLKAQRCRVISGRGDFSQCQLTLPCSGDLLLKACAIAFANGTAVPGKPCYTAPIGRNASSWASSPWQHQPLLRVEPEQQRYAQGDTPKLAFFNPYYGLPASAVVVYGNQVAKKTKYFASVPAGPNALALDPIGDECAGGCRVTLALAVPRPPPGEASSAAAVPNIVPRSVVFDPLAPHVETADLTLSVPYPNLANVSIAIEGAGVDYDPSPAEQDEELLAFGGLDPKDAAALALPLFNTSLLPGGRINAPKPDEPAPESDPNAPIPVVRPSSKTATVRVSVVDAATGLPAANAEVTVMAVDKAVLALLPVDLRLLGATDLKPALQGDHRAFSANDVRANAAAVDAVFSALRRRMRLDPFLPVDTTINPSSALFYGGWPSSVSYPLPGAADQPDNVYLARYRTAVTVTPRYDWSELARYGAGATGGGAAAASLRFGKNFRMTPLFAVVKTNAQGVATVAFPAPENTGAFVVRAYAATDAPRSATRSPPPSRAPTKYGAAGTELIVRLPITLTPSVPRLVRVGDAFEAGVVVAAPLVRTQRSQGKAEVEVTAQLVGEIRADNSSSTAAAVLELIGGGGEGATKTVRLSRADQQEEVRFSWSAGAIGRARVVFSARVVGGDEGDADALEQEIEVQGRQAPVFVATSFALAPGDGGGGGGARNEGLVLPAADLGAGGSLDLVAGVGSLPAIQASYGQLLTQGKLMRGEDDEEEEGTGAKAGARNATTAAPSTDAADSGEVLPAYLAVATASLPAFMASYGSSASRLPPASAEASARAARDAAGPLTAKPDSGLVYSPPPSATDAWGGRETPRADAWLSSWGTWVVEQAAASSSSGAASLPPPLAADFAKMRAAAQAQWKPAAAKAIVRDSEEARRRGYSYDDWSTLSWARLVLGAGWSPPAGTDPAAAADDLAMPRLVEAALAGNASAGAVARTALALEASGKNPAAALKLRERLLSSLRATGRTAYLSYAPGAAGAAPLEAQAFALLLLSSPAPNVKNASTAANNPLVQKLAAYVAQGGSALSSSGGYGALCVSVSGADAAVAAAALAAYDARRGSTDPDLRVSVVAAGDGGASPSTLLEAEFTPSNAGATASSSTPWAGLPARNASLLFNAEGRGEATVAAGLSFTPANLLNFPTYRGIYVERIIQSESGEGSALRAVPLASVVTVSVQITTPDDLQGVVVDVWMPGALEPLDPNVYSDASSAITCGSGNEGGWASSPSPRWYGWWLCPKSSVSPSSVRLSYSYLPAGARTVKLKAIAATAGEFVLPPTKAYVSAQPEVMGLSAAAKLIVCDLGPAAARRAAGTGEKSCGPGSEVGAVEAPRACPAPAGGGQGLACSGNGACDLSRGACVCQAGFTGKACEVAAAVAAA